MICLVIIFLTPGIFAYLFYQHPNWLSGVTTNKGQLLKPPVYLAKFTKETKWGLLLWNPGLCLQNCRQQLNKMTRVRVALGRRFYDVQLWLGSQKIVSSKMKTLLDQQGIGAVQLKEADLQRVLGDKSRLFMVNPEHYLILSYPLDANPADIYSDLQRVLNLQRTM